MPIEYHKIAGHYQGTLMGLIYNTESMRKGNLMSDSELLTQVLERLKLALDKGIKGDIQ